MFTQGDEEEFQQLLAKFKENKILREKMEKLSFEDLFSWEFLSQNSDFLSLDDILFRSGFGIMSPMEISKLSPEKWDNYIAAHSKRCSKWHEFGKLAMTAWMKKENS
jgi:hypothetical protein